jgi:hypothetical protein
MTDTLWIAAGIAVLVALVYVIWVAGHARKSGALDKQIDYGKLKKISDDED